MQKNDWQKKGAGHRQRLRDKFLARGIDAFTDSEVLELLLTLGTPRQDCKEPARAALARFGSLATVLTASPKELQAVPGIGPGRAVPIVVVLVWTGERRPLGSQEGPLPERAPAVTGGVSPGGPASRMR